MNKSGGFSFELDCDDIEFGFRGESEEEVRAHEAEMRLREELEATEPDE